jgi:hypothetical protein
MYYSANNNGLYRFLDATGGRFVDYLRICRRDILLKRQLRLDSRLRFIREHIASLIVDQGPFKGMRYPAAKSCGSALVPKLIGSYECELHAIIEEICSQQYRIVIDIGCAEGYYAVGLALRIPSAYVIAFDTNTEATELCRLMADLNRVGHRVITAGWCDEDVLALLTSGGRSLIVCDTEGYEKTLFSESLVPLLSGHDLLIETHDIFEPGISDLLQERFSSTHEIVTTESVPDILKSRECRSPLLRQVKESERVDLVTEGRPDIMKWLYLKSRQPGLLHRTS